MGYSISFSRDARNFENEIGCTGSNATFYTTYADDNPHIDINYIISDYVVTIPLHTELVISAEDFFRDKNHRIAVIEADTAVESLISKILRKYYSEDLTLPAGDFKETFLKKLEDNRLDDNIPYLKLISRDIVGGKEWSNWKTKCHEIRNGIIHRNRKPIRDEAEKAIASAKAVIELLKDYFYEENDWLNEGKAFSSDKHTAIKYFNKCIKKNKSKAEAYFYLGNIYLHNREFDPTINYYRKALKFRQWTDCYYNIGRAYEEQEIYNDALTYFDKSIDLKYELDHPHNNPYYRKFLIYMREGLKSYDVDEILEILLILFKFFPNYSEFPYNLAVTYSMKKDYDNAILYMDKLIEISPNNPDHYLQRAKYQIKLGNKEGSLDDIERAVNIDSRLKEPIKKHTKFKILNDSERFKSIVK